MGEVNDGQIVPADHADSLRLTRPDGTLPLIPAKCVLAIDAVLRRCAMEYWYLKVSPCDNVTGGWQARLTFAVTTINGEPAGTPWQAVLSLAEKLKENTP